jgi:RNA methyltransferase, TrmH family
MKGTLTSDGLCVAEGFHMIEEAIRSDREISALVVADSAGHQAERWASGNVVTVPDALFRHISSTETPQGILGLIRPRPRDPWDVFMRGTPLILIVDGIQDPGNAGAVVRSAEAFGATGVIFLRGSVSPYNPKAIRASAGSSFRMPIAHEESAAIVVETCAAAGVTIYAAMPNSGLTVSDADLNGACAFVVGAEGRGVSEEMNRAAMPIHIPTHGVESLNTAVAAAILSYEASRQRSGRK